MRKFLTTSLLALSCCMAQAQSQGNAKADSVKTAPQSVLVTGIIKDAATGKPAAGVRVSVAGFSADITDNDGSFSVKVPDLHAQLVVAGEGYQTRLVPLKGRKKLSVDLHSESIESVYENINMPGGNPLRSEVSAAAAQVNTNGTWDQPLEIPDALLQGRVAGLNTVRRSGAPGAGANLFLRGFNSLYGTNKPLLIVDNMIYDYNDYGESIIANNYTNPLAFIEAKDIANVTVLKDASSVYGTKGANGAIIITTSRAKQQATKIDFGMYAGANAAPTALPVMNATEYRSYLADMLQSKGLSSAAIAAMPFMIDDKSHPEYYATHNNTNWQKKVLQNSINQNYFLKVTGGDNIATYALSMGFMDNKGIIKGTDMKRYNTRFNAEMNFSQRFTGSANLSFTYNEQNLKDQGIANNTNPLFLALAKAPFYTDREVNAVGDVSPNPADVDALGIGNPTALIDLMQGYNKYYRFYGSFGFKYQISNKVSASTLFGVTYDKVRENIFIPRKGVKDDTTSNAILESRLGAQVKRLFTLYTDSRISFDNKNTKNNLKLNLGLRYQNNSAEQDIARTFNSATDELVSVQNGVSLLRQVGGSVGEWNWMNIYANAEYNYRQRFFLSLNAAMDASSRFGKQATEGIMINDIPFAVMPSVTAAWLLSSEKFMANSAISLLRLRASWSKTGNDDIGNYSSRQTYTVQSLLGMQGLVRTGIGNPALQWENVQRTNLGVDVGLLNDRLQLFADVWQNKTTKMLVYEQLPTTAGMRSVLTNNGAMQTRGIDLSVNFRAINKAHLKWDIGFNATTYKNKVTTVPGGSFETSFAGADIITKEGAVANQFFGLQANGVYATDAAAATAGLQRRMADGSLRPFTGGDVIYTDLNADKIIDANDRIVIGNPNASWIGGFSNRLSWKRFTIEALFTFSAGNDVYNYLRHQLESMNGTNNQLQSANNRWKSNGQITNMPKATYGDPMGNADFSSRWIEDGAYLRLRTLSIAYNIPMSGKGMVKDMNVYLNGNNLLTFTKYLGYDPEFSANPSVFAQGIDTGLTPQFASAMFGLKLGL